MNSELTQTFQVPTRWLKTSSSGLYLTFPGARQHTNKGVRAEQRGCSFVFCVVFRMNRGSLHEKQYILLF